MAEAAKPRLALVDRAIAEQPEDTDAKNEALRRILAKHTPVIAKLVRAEVTAELTQKAGVAVIEELSALPALRASFEREEAKHVKAGRWQGRAQGLVAGLFMAVAFVWGYLLVSASHDHQMVVTGAAINASNPQVCVPGEPLPDGRICPEPHAIPHLESVPAP